MKEIVLVCFTLALCGFASCGYRKSLESCGLKTGTKEHPWVIRIEAFINSIDSLCHGVLINEQYALAPHHCFGSFEDVKAGNTKAKAILKNEQDEKMEIEIVEIKKFASRVPTEYADLALLKLASPVDRQQFPSVCLPDSDPYGNLVVLNEDYVGRELVVSEVPVQLYNLQRCKEEYLNSMFRYPLESDRFCVSGDKQFTCDGTALGLMFQKRGDHYTIAGIFSFDACSTSLMNGYVRVNDYISQIKEMIAGKVEEVTLMPTLAPLFNKKFQKH